MKARSKTARWLLIASGTFFLSGLAAGDLPASSWTGTGAPLAAFAQEDSPRAPPEDRCAPDAHGARSRLSDMLTGSDPLHVEWRTRVGLPDADPARLTVVTEDSLCLRLSSAISLRAPIEDYAVTFFRIDDVYIITVYPNRPVMGYRLTAVIDDEFNVVKPLLAD